MKIKFTKSLFSGNRSYVTDEVADMPDIQAIGIIKRGFAVPVKDEPIIETADVAPIVEKAVKSHKAK